MIGVLLFALSCFVFLAPIGLYGSSGIYQPSSHTLFYLPLDGPNAGTGENCSINDPIGILSYIPDRFGNPDAATHVAGFGNYADNFYIGCANTQIGSSPSQSLTVGYWIRISQPLSPGAYQYCDTNAACDYRIFTVWAQGLNYGCTKYLVSETYAASSEGAWPDGCGIGNDNLSVPTSTLSIADGNWHNVLWVFDYAHERIEFYLDGALNVIGKLPNPPIAAQDAQWVAGAENGTLALNGDMDDLWVEDHAWTDSEVASYFSGPAFALSPPSLYFAGTGASKMTVTNSGSTVLSIPVPPTFGGFNASDFSLASDTSCTNGVTLAPGAHCTLDVSFTPSTSAAESAQLILFNGTNGSPQMALVSGGASVTSISPNPVLGLDGRQTITVFGNGFQTGQVLNYANLGRSETKVFTVTPKVLSSTELTATIPFTDASATWVIQVANPGDPACDLTTQEPNCLSFEVVGDDYTGVNVNDYPFENSPIDANIKGAQFPFRECTSYVQWRMNRNSGTLNPNHPFFFNGMGGGTWGNADTWNVNASNLHYTVDNNAEVGAIAQWVSIDHVAYVEKVNPDSSLVVSEYNYGLDDSGAKHQFGIRTIAPGKGYPENFIHVPFLTFSQNSLNFGNQTRDTTASQILTLVNGGQMPVSVTGISTSASQFSASPSNCTKVNPCSIAAGASFEITVNFTPSAQGPYATALKVSYTDVVALTQTIPLAGTGI